MEISLIERDWNTKFPDRKLIFYRDQRFKIVFGVPSDWKNNCSSDLFQLEEPATETYFTASAYEMKGMPLRGWAKIRLSVVIEKMPYLRMVGDPYSIDGRNWSGYAADFEGQFPGKDYKSHYFVLCLSEGTKMISFTITTRKKIFDDHKDFYLSLVQSTLIVEK